MQFFEGYLPLKKKGWKIPSKISGIIYIFLISNSSFFLPNLKFINTQVGYFQNAEYPIQISFTQLNEKRVGKYPIVQKRGG